MYPQAESASKTRTLRQKVRFEASKTCTLKQKVRQKHVPFGKKSAPVELRDGIEPPSRTPPKRASEALFSLNHTSFIVYFATCRI